MIGYISMVKDESDVIYWNLIHYRNLGIRNFYLLDNQSEDNTWELIRKFSTTFKDCRVCVSVDTEVRYLQSEKMTRLAEHAFKDGCKFILPVDADELFFGDLEKMCAQIQSAGCIRFPWKIYWPTEKDDYSQTNPFLRMQYWSDFQLSPGKIIIRWQPGMRIRQGNHGLERPYGGLPTAKGNVFSAHFSWRSKDHLRKKIINLGKAYENMKDIFNHKPSNENYLEYQKHGEDFISAYWKSIETESNRLKHDPLSSELFTPVQI